jgi:hypothetical protein
MNDISIPGLWKDASAETSEGAEPMEAARSRPGQPGSLACTSCGSPVSAGARLCPTCRQYQARWKNDFSYFASIAGFFAIAASALAFLGGGAVDLVHRAMWTDSVDSAFFEYPGTSGFTNTGDGDVILQSVFLRWTGPGGNPRTMELPLNEVLHKGEFRTITMKSQYVEPADIDAAKWARNELGLPSDALLADAEKFADATRCAVFHVFNASHLAFRFIGTLDDHSSLVTVPATADLVIYRLHSATQATIPLGPMNLAILRITDRAGCVGRA